MHFLNVAKTLVLALSTSVLTSPLTPGSLAKCDDSDAGIRVMSNAEAEYFIDHSGKLDYDSSLADPEAGAQIGDDGVYLSQEVGGWPQKNPSTQKPDDANIHCKISVVKTPKDLNDEEFWYVPRKKWSDDEDHKLWDNGNDIIEKYIDDGGGDKKKANRISRIAGRQGYLQAWFSQDRAKELEFKAEILDTTGELEAAHPNLKVNWDFKNIKGKLDPE
ncbi:hypothetical protein SCUP515_08306 [Seiridium cupressi]